MREEIIATAKEYVGTTYDASNDIKFVTDYYGRKTHRRIAYCVMFVWDIFRIVGASAFFCNGKKTASCTNLLSWYKNHIPDAVTNDLSKIEPGDLVLYNFDGDSNPDHIGIFESKISGSKFYAIEGNTSNKTLLGDQANGGWVMRKARKTSQVKTFIHIDFPEGICPYTEPTKTVAKGTKGNDAAWVQWYLRKAGYSLTIDGSFGSASVKILRLYQASKGLDVDGRCGAETRKALKGE